MPTPGLIDGWAWRGWPGVCATMSVTCVGEMDQAAHDQLAALLAAEPRVERVVVMPDVHAGPGIPVGVALLTRGVVLPKYIGTDIGCGMTLFGTGLKPKGKAGARVAAKLRAAAELALPFPDAAALMAANGLATDAHAESLGSLGGGNHFAEFLAVEAVHDAAALESVGVNPDRVQLLVHTGSRGVGGDVAARHGAELTALPDIQAYIRDHDVAVQWATANRMLVAHRVAAAAGTDVDKKLDIVHNYLELNYDAAGERVYVHRKGVGRVGAGQVTVLPGSRGSRTYLVRMTDDAAVVADHLGSVAHGAGRRLTRHKAEAATAGMSRQQLATSSAGSHVVCDSKALLQQEHECAYKDVGAVLAALQGAGLVSLVATLTPLCTYKN